MIRDTLEKNKSVDCIWLDSTLWNGRKRIYMTTSAIGMLVDAIYTGNIGVESALSDCVDAYIFGHMTGTLILQQAAAARFKKIIGADNNEPEISYCNFGRVLCQLYARILEANVTVDKVMDKHGIRECFVNHGFPLVYKDMTEAQLGFFIRSSPVFAADLDDLAQQNGVRVFMAASGWGLRGCLLLDRQSRREKMEVFEFTLQSA
ncbi:hypothetical protein BKA81DRAFT_374923 [Phyllosticta paracitricarpa]